VGLAIPDSSSRLELTPEGEVVSFQSYFDAGQMPEAKYAVIDLPYLGGIPALRSEMRFWETVFVHR